MTGVEVREMILAAGVRIWQVADRLGMTDSTFSRRLRYEFSEDEVSQIRSIIKDLQA